MRSLQWVGKPFNEFFLTLIQALEAEGVRYCILRNYEGFPISNSGNDIDFLISAHQLPQAIYAIRSIQGVRIVGYAERGYVASVFLEGISRPGIARALQIDFDVILPWKGLPFLTTDVVLNSAIPRVAGNASFFVPSPIYESITSLFTSLVIAGELKDKYFPRVQSTFADNRLEVIDALLPQFGLKTATGLVDAVIGGDRRKVRGCVWSLRRSLAVRSLVRRPVASLLAIFRHYTNELAFRFSPTNLEAVSVLGVEGSGKATVIETLIPLLRSTAVVVEKISPRWPLPLVSKSRGAIPGADSNTQTSSGYLISMAKVVACLIDKWLKQLMGRRSFTLRIGESFCPDLLVDPERCRYGGPIWFARCICKFFPSPDLWIMLDPVPEGLQLREREAPTAETHRQLEAFRAFMKKSPRYVILAASEAADRITEVAYAAIVDMLADRADRRLKNRFHRP